MRRIVAIRHRIKFTRDQESRPTEVAIKVIGKTKVRTLTLDTEDDELDWLRCRYPVKFRKVEPSEDLGLIEGLNPRHIKWKKVESEADLGRHQSQLLIETKVLQVTQILEGKDDKQVWRKIRVDEDVSSYAIDFARIKTRKVKPGQDLSEHHASQIIELKTGDPTHYAVKVPSDYDGLIHGDEIAMTLGGSGDPFAYALSRRASELTTSEDDRTGVYRLPPAFLKEYRDSQKEGTSKSKDFLHLLALYEKDPTQFHFTGPRDRELIRMGQLLRERQIAQAARKAAVQRLESSVVGAVFLSDELPESTIADLKVQAIQRSIGIKTLIKDEDAATRRLEKCVKSHEVYQRIFDDIKGVGPVLAASLIVPIRDPRRFTVAPDQSDYEDMRRERNDLLKKGRFKADRDACYAWLRNQREDFRERGLYKEWLDGGDFPSNMPLFVKLQAAARYKDAIGFPEQAQALRDASEHTQMLCSSQYRAKFKSAAKLRAFCGVHVRQGGKYADVPPEKAFPRKRSGEVCNWNPLARQALYLLGDQFNRRKATVWGAKFLEEKRLLREIKHPEVIEVDGKKRYTNGHIHNMARWKTLNKFVTWLYHEWMKIYQT